MSTLEGLSRALGGVALGFSLSIVCVQTSMAQEAKTASAPAVRQPAVDSQVVYRREVFEYSRAGRPDPFRSLVGSADLGVRLEDLSLRGVVVHPDASLSVAVIAREGNPRLIRARVGDRIGGIRILAIRPRSIEVIIEDLGVARRETIEITRVPASKG